MGLDKHIGIFECHIHPKYRPPSLLPQVVALGDLGFFSFRRAIEVLWPTVHVRGAHHQHIALPMGIGVTIGRSHLPVLGLPAEVNQPGDIEAFVAHNHEPVFDETEFHRTDHMQRAGHAGLPAALDRIVGTPGELLSPLTRPFRKLL